MSPKKIVLACALATGLLMPVSAQGTDDLDMDMYPNSNYVCSIGDGTINVIFEPKTFEIIEEVNDRHTEIKIPYSAVKDWYHDPRGAKVMIMELRRPITKSYYNERFQLAKREKIHVLLLFPTTRSCRTWGDVNLELANRVPYLGDR